MLGITNVLDVLTGLRSFSETLQIFNLDRGTQQDSLHAAAVVSDAAGNQCTGVQASD